MSLQPRLPAILAVLLLHALGLALLWGGSWPAGPAAREPLTLRLIASPPVPSAPAAPPVAPVPPAAAAAMAAAPALPAPAPLAVAVLSSPPPAPPTAAGAAGPAPPAVASPAPATPAPPALAAPAVTVALGSAEPLQPARRAACPPAPHPPLLRERGIEGLVRLRVWVDELGRAGDVRVAASSGFRLFDEAAVAQARRCPYEAARQGQREVASWVEFPVRFALLQSGESDAPP